MVLGIQLIGIMFTIFMVYLTFINYKQQRFSNGEWIVWLGAWISFLIITLFPSILNPILETLSLYRAMDLYVSIGFLFFIVIMFYTYTSLRSVQRKIETLTREVAIIEATKPRKRK